MEGLILLKVIVFRLFPYCFLGNSKVVFIGNLSWTTNNDSLFEFLSHAGDVVSAQVQRHEDTNRSKGWG
jgi:RNA recognition motif-containing protein